MDYTAFKLGWKRDRPDSRDQAFVSTVAGSRALLPVKIDLRKQFPSVYHQGFLGSCTANAIGALFEFCRKKQGRTTFMPSRLFIYYNERVVEGSITQDDGAEIRTGMKVCKKLGICREDLWPYDDGNKIFKKKPNKGCYAEALNYQIIQYEKLDHTLRSLKSCLADGYPFALGIELFDSFYSSKTEKTGKVLIPKVDESYIGGHAVCCVGYDDKNKQFIIRNSWGADWGKQGYCFLPYDYILNPELADSFWMMRVVE